jgi:hypothetical protein
LGKSDFRRIAETMRESGEALAEGTGRAAELQKELEDLFSSQNQGKDATPIPRRFLRVTVALRKGARSGLLSLAIVGVS